MWFQRYEFLKDPPLHFMGEALGILYNQTFFCSGLEHLFIRWMQPTFYMLCLTCPCHHRNDQLSASWQDYLDTSYWLHKLYPIFGECIGSTSGHARNTGISPRTSENKPQLTLPENTKVLNNPKGKPVLLTLLYIIKLISNCLKHIVAPQ